MAVAGVAVAGRTPQLRAHQRQRELPREQFVEGEPRPERAIGKDVRQLDRHMDTLKRFRERRKFASADHVGADPLRQRREFLQGLRDRTAQRAKREAFGQGIDGIDTGQFCKRGFVDHAVGMHDLRNAVIHLQGAGDVALGADRQQFLDIARLGAEKGQHHLAGIVAGIDEVRRARNCVAVAAGGGRR